MFIKTIYNYITIYIYIKTIYAHHNIIKNMSQKNVKKCKKIRTKHFEYLITNVMKCIMYLVLTKHTIKTIRKNMEMH